MDKKLIQEWVEKGIVSLESSKIMLVDLDKAKKETNSQNLITGLSTIGSVVLGLGVILFVASNWQYFSASMKVIMLVFASMISLWGGYWLKYVNKNFPRVGSAIFLLSSLIYCASIFLITQIYHVNAYNHQLIILCLVGIAPFVYIQKSVAFSVLFMAGFYIWLAFFAFRSLQFENSSNAFVGLPVLFLVTSVLIFFLGGFHYLLDNGAKIARIFRLAGIQVALIMLLVLTINIFSGKVDSHFITEYVKLAYGQLVMVIVGVSVLGFLVGLGYFAKNPAKSNVILVEVLVGLLILIMCIIFVLTPRTTDVFMYVFNLLIIGFLLGIFVIGYKNGDMNLVNISIFYISVYIFVRYVDLFWEALDRSVFFIIGGTLLVGGGMFLENQRRRLKLLIKSEDKNE